MKALLLGIVMVVMTGIEPRKSGTTTGICKGWLVEGRERVVLVFYLKAITFIVTFECN